ncbi:MAG: 5-formyltetrahydrofolate cyclo-ligase [Actinomycetes bacterium]
MIVPDSSKAALRRRVLARRGTLEAEVLAAAARDLSAVVLGIPEVRTARCVAAYVSVGREPGTRHLLDVLAKRGVLVLVPVVLADRALDWAAFDSSDALEPAAHGLLEPTGPRLGVDAIARVDVVLAPALAVDRSGHRLGRGGGFYDRALARVRPGTFVTALLHDGELLPPRQRVPTGPRDVAVGAAAEPIGLTRLP